MVVAQMDQTLTAITTQDTQKRIANRKSLPVGLPLFVLQYSSVLQAVRLSHFVNSMEHVMKIAAKGAAIVVDFYVAVAVQLKLVEKRNKPIEKNNILRERENKKRSRKLKHSLLTILAI